MKKKWVIITLVIVAVGLIAGYNYMYKEHRDIAGEDADFTLHVADLQKSFTENDSLANAKYADKTIVVSGKVTGIDSASHSITIDEKLSASLNGKSVEPKLQQQVTVKGRFVGYDDLLEELKMDQVTITK